LRRLSALAALALVSLAGCYASTEPATNVGPETATLNARGTANNGPASSSFAYWISGTTGRVRGTDERHWPAGASGPFSEKIKGLYASKQYSFRLCGSDDSGGLDACAQTRTFTTRPAVDDSVVGEWGSSPHFYGTIDAHSGPSGQSPRGKIWRFSGVGNSPSLFEGFVICVAVSGDRAAVGAVGHETVQDPPNWHPATLLATVVDGGPSGDDTLSLVLQQGSTPPSCANASFGNQPNLLWPDDVVVNDAP
jgi:hypothetical protein